MSMIDDPELRELFKVESEEHLQLLDEGLLHLEKNPDDAERLHEVFREAHSLKGAARMLGISDVETLSHLIEDILGSASKGSSALTPEKIDTIYEGLDAVRKFVDEAVTGEKAGIDPIGIIDRLSAESKDSRSAGIPRPAAESPAPVPPAPERPASTPPAARARPASPATAEPTAATPAPPTAEPAATPAASAKPATPASQPAGSESPVPPAPASDDEEDDSVVMIELDGPIEPMLPLAESASSQAESSAATTRPAPATPSTPAPSPAPAAAPEPTAQPSADSGPTTTSTTPATSTPAETPDAPVTRQPAPAAEPAAAASSQSGESNAPPAGGSATDRYKVDTIRVKPEKLDALMTQAGELTVTRIRISRRPQEIEYLMEDLESVRGRMSELQQELRQIAQNETEDAGVAENNQVRLAELIADSRKKIEAVERSLQGMRSNAYEDGARLELIASRLEDGIREVRMLPLSTVFGLFPRTVRDLAREQSKQVDFVVEGGETLADKRIIEEIKDPLMHMVRNAVDHGIEKGLDRKDGGKEETARLCLRAEGSARSIMIAVEDDGRGLDPEKIKNKALARGLYKPEEIEAMSTEQIQKLIFAPGFSTSDIITDVSGRGVGMDVVMSKVQQLKGSVVLDSQVGHGTSIQLHLPITLSTTRVLLLNSAGQTYALPVDYVETTRMVPREDIFSIEGKDTVILEDLPVSLVALTELLPILGPPGGRQPRTMAGRERFPIIFVKIGNDQVGFIVDELIDEQEIILKDQGGILKRVPNVLGMTILESGAVCVVLNVPDLVQSVVATPPRTATVLSEGEAPKKKIVLLVEDSITTRMQEKRILERAGYEVVVAVDGQDGFEKLGQKRVDAIVSDVEMPRLNGFELTRQIRAREEWSDLPVVLVTTLAGENDIRTGMEAGANAYITKRAFDQSILLETLKRLI